MDMAARVIRLEQFKDLIAAWRPQAPNAALRAQINQRLEAARREVIKAKCVDFVDVTPPAGGTVHKRVNPFDCFFTPPHGVWLGAQIIDMIDRTIGVIQDETNLSTESHPPSTKTMQALKPATAFVAMAMNPADHALIDVLDALVDGSKRAGIEARRIDGVESNERITDRILAEIESAEFVIVDLTDSRPNVFYEAGYAQGLGKTPIYVARAGTHLEFDLKDYPVIFFNSMRDLRDRIEKRFQGLAEKKAAKA